MSSINHSTMQKSLKGIVLAIIMIQFVCSNLFAQTTPPPTGPTGKISGKIIDKANGEVIISAVIKAKNNSTGASKGATSDFDGKFILKLPVGNYSLTISYPGYTKDSIPSVDVIEGQVKEIDLAIEEKIMTTGTIVVIGQLEKESSNFVIAERKNSAVVSDGVSSEQFKKTPDRTTGDVLKRVTGASIQEGKFAIIRGMNDRYNAGYLNDAPLPSTEADRKAFSFDVIPANLIDNLVITKAGSPDVTGDFAGGVIQIRTKAIPAALTQSLNIGGQYNSMATFKDATTFKRYTSNSFGIVNPERELPSSITNLYTKTQIPKTAEINTNLVPSTKLFNNDWSTETFKAMPNLRFSYSIGFPTKLFGKQLGVIAALTYANTRSLSENTIRQFDAGNANKLDKEFKDKSYKQNVTSGAILNLSYKLSDKHIVGIRNFYNINADMNTTERSGSFGMSSNGLQLAKSYANSMSYNRLLTNQVYGEHAIGYENPYKIKWYVNNANINRLMPDYRIANYTSSVDEPNGQLNLQTTDFFKTGTGRFFSTMKENLTNAETNVSKHVNILGLKTDIKIGVFYQYRTREFNSRTFVYGGKTLATNNSPSEDLGIDNISKDGVYLVEKTNQTDAYKSQSKLFATYAMFDQKFGLLRALYGVRLESFGQQIFTYRLNGNVSDSAIFATKYDFLPSLNLSYALSEKTNLRFAGYRTLNRPEFRELASFAFYRFDIDSDQLGTNNLKRASIANFEMRLEYFPSAGQVVSGGVFMKNVSDPIENKLDPTQTTRTFFFSNEKSAKVYGIELEFRKNLSFIKDVKFWQNTTAYANFALVKSTVSFYDEKAAYTRPLQGQSPYIINGGIQHENSDNGWNYSLAFNRTGKRIAFVGLSPEVSPYNGDIYEMPRTVIDLQVSKTIGKFNIKGTFGDILHQNLNYLQEGTENGVAYKNELFSYKMPWTFTLTGGIQF